MPTFAFELLRNPKQHVVAHWTLQRQLDEGLFKVFMPYIVQDSLQHDFRKGEYVFLATKVSRAFEAHEFHAVLDMVGPQAKLFEKDLVSIFPKKSQPKVLVREFLEQGQRTRPRQKNYRVFFGYMIPKYSKAYNLDVGYLRATVGFKYGLMLLYQFIYFVTEVNRRGLHFGHLDFSNLYFLKNGLSKPQPGRKRTQAEAAKSPKSSAKSVKSAKSAKSASGSACDASDTFRALSGNQRFTLNLLFLDKNLMDLIKRETAESPREPPSLAGLKGRSLSQTTREEQEAFTARHLDLDFEDEDFVTQRDDAFALAGELEPARGRKSTYVKRVQSYLYGHGDLEIEDKHAADRATAVREAFDASVRKYEADLESIRIFVYTIREHCLRFSSYHSQLSQKANLDFLNAHEDERRQDFVDKFEAIIEERFKERLLQKLEQGRASLSEFSEEDFQQQELDVQVFCCCMDDCLELCSEFIALFENKTFWGDIVSNHRQTIWMRKQEQLGAQIQKRPMTAAPALHRVRSGPENESDGLVPQLGGEEADQQINASTFNFSVPGHKANKSLQIEELMEMTIGLDKLSRSASSKQARSNPEAQEDEDAMSASKPLGTEYSDLESVQALGSRDMPKIHSGYYAASVIGTIPETVEEDGAGLRMSSEGGASRLKVPEKPGPSFG